MLEPSLEIQTKLETLQIGDENTYWVYLSLAIEGDNIQAEGNATQPIRFSIAKKEWDRLNVGDRLWFKHTTTVKADGQEIGEDE